LTIKPENKFGAALGNELPAVDSIQVIIETCESSPTEWFY